MVFLNTSPFCRWYRLNRLTPDNPYMGRTAPLTSKHCILYIYSTNIGTEYFKHALYSPFLSLQNAICFIMLTCLVPALFTFYIQDVLKLKKNNSGAKGWSGYISLHKSDSVFVITCKTTNGYKWKATGAASYRQNLRDLGFLRTFVS